MGCSQAVPVKCLLWGVCVFLTFGAADETIFP